MVDFILTMIFILTVVCIWLLRNWRLREIEKQEKIVKEEKKAVVTIVPDELTNVRINNETVNVQVQTTSQTEIQPITQNNTYPDSDIETEVPPTTSNTNSDSVLQHEQPASFTDDNGNDVFEEDKPAEIIVGDEVPTSDELVNNPEKKVPEDTSVRKQVLDASIDYASIADYFSGKLDTGEPISSEEETVDGITDGENENVVVWSGNGLIDERNSRTVILADEMTPGEAYVYYRQNLSGEMFKGLVIADNHSEEDYNNRIVRARYARQAINGEYKKGFIIRSADISSLKFYTATKDEIADFLGRRPETMNELDDFKID